jgi:two-component system, NtrC family, response regulator HydG
LVGQSLAIRRAIRLIEEAAPTSAPVIITGESGTGKELAARAIHDKSPRRSRPFVPINCAAVPETLIESELFGHERGAFTGADRRREGCFERANGGTLLLDEITEMRPEMQAKLLRVLQDKKISRLGGSGEVAVDVRILAASNRELQRSIREGRLRADLYYRLNVVSLELPPLRHRIEDVLLLAEEFVRTFNREHRKTIEGIAPDCLDALKAHSWPGNVRELRNAIERAVIMSRSPILSVGDLPKEISSQPGPTQGFTVRLGSTLEEVENELIARTISFAGGNKSRAAQILGVGRRTLYKQPERYSVHETNGHSNGRPYRNGRNGSS